ncbi:mCG147704 [Mus musculus]|nr:mCG147704 [Mus musculus]
MSETVNLLSLASVRPRDPRADSSAVLNGLWCQRVRAETAPSPPHGMGSSGLTRPNACLSGVMWDPAAVS